MKTNYQEKSETELKKILIEKREALRRFGFDAAGSKTTNVKMGRNLRKDIAQILTFLGRVNKKPN